MTDPLLEKAAALKRLCDETQSAAIDKHMAEIMKILLENIKPLDADLAAIAGIAKKVKKQ